MSYHPFEVLGIEPTTDENIIRIAYEQQLKHAETEEEKWNIRTAYQNCLVFIFQKKEDIHNEENIFDEKDITGNNILPGDDESFKTTLDPEQDNTSLN